MKTHVGDILFLHTGDYGLVTEVRSSYVVLAPGVEGVSDRQFSGRYHEVNDIKFALDYSASVNYELVKGKVYAQPHLKYFTPKIGKGEPRRFRDIREHWHVLSYVDSDEDVQLLLNASPR